MVKFGRWSKLQVLSVGFALTVALLSSACETTGSAERAWLHGMNRVPVASLQEGQSSLLAEILKNPGGWGKRPELRASRICSISSFRTTKQSIYTNHILVLNN